MSSAATHLFEQIGENAAAQTFIEKMISDKRLENEHLDYKGASRIPENDIKKHWSKALSAFANTGGGVLLWGVDCRKVKQPNSIYEIDEPTGTSLHPNAIVLAQQLAELVHSATEDTVEGVQIRAVRFNGGDPGCVVCLIPEGKNKPYRAKLVDEKYFMRAPDRMEVIPHSLLRSLFYPTSAPELEVWVEGECPERISGRLSSFRFFISVKNVGTASAKETFIKLLVSNPMMMQSFYGKQWEEQPEVIRPLAGTGTDFRFFSIQSIHPTVKQNVCRLEAKLSESEILRHDAIVLSFEVYLYDGKSKRLTVKFLPNEMTMPPTVRKALPIEQTK